MSATPDARHRRAIFVLTALAFIPLVLLLALPLPALGAPTHSAPPVSPSLAKPNTIFVTNTNDSGPGSLRNAIALAGLGDAIYFASTVSGTITLTSGELVITKYLSIVGPGESVLAISGNNASRVILIGGDTFVDISGLTIKEGRLLSDSLGAGVMISPSVYSGSYVNLTNVSIVSNTISDSVCDGCGGAGIMTDYFSTVNLTNVTIKWNQVQGSTSCNGCYGAGIFNVNLAILTNANISDNSISSGSCTECLGGGIANDGLLYLSNVTLNNNSVSSPSCIGCHGGGLFTFGLANLTNVELNGNTVISGTLASAKPNPAQSKPNALSAFSRSSLVRRSIKGVSTSPNAPQNGFPPFPTGGGIFNGEFANLTNVTLNGNSVIGPDASGGGILNVGPMNATNVTVNANSAEHGGGVFHGLFPGSALTLTNATLNGNSASLDGGNVYVLTDTVFVRNTIIANSPSGGNCYIAAGTISSGGNNLRWPSSDASCVGTFADPMLAPLGNFGGFTKTMPPFAGSAALDAADDLLCLAFDQRGAPRPQGAHCDIGAVEFGSGLRFLYLPFLTGAEAPTFRPAR